MKAKLSFCLSLFAIAAMILTACGPAAPAPAPAAAPTQASAPEPAQAVEATQAPAPAKAAEPLKITWMIPNQQNLAVGASVPITDIQTKFNVQFEFIEADPRTDAYNQKKKLTIASQDLPDMMSWVTKDEANQYGPEGAFLDLTPLLATKLPTVKKLMDADPNGKWNAFAADGKLWRVPQIMAAAHPIYDFSYIKKEFDAVGATELNTWDQVYDALTKLKAKYPDSYPFTFRGKDIGGWGLRALFEMSFTEGRSGAGAIGLTDGSAFQPDTKQYIFGATAPGYKEAIQFLNKMYTDGLLDPEYLTLTIDQITQRLKDKKAFMICDYVGGLSGHDPVQSQIDNALYPLRIPVNDGKKQIIGFKGAMVTTNGTVVNAKLSGAKLDTVLAILDYLYTPEFYDLLYWNPDISATVDGKKVYTNEAMYKRDYTVMDLYLPWAIEANFLSNYETTTKPGTIYGDYFLNWLAAPENADKYIEVPTIPFDTAQTKRLAELTTAINDAFNSQIDQFIMGKKSFNDWDAFIADLKAKGADELVKIYNDSYQKYFKQ